MDFSEEVSTWAGRLIVAIGEGKFRDAVAVMLSAVSSEAFERGVEAGKLQAKNAATKAKLK